MNEGRKEGRGGEIEKREERQGFGGRSEIQTQRLHPTRERREKEERKKRERSEKEERKKRERSEKEERKK